MHSFAEDNRLSACISTSPTVRYFPAREVKTKEPLGKGLGGITNQSSALNLSGAACAVGLSGARWDEKFKWLIRGK